MAGLWDTRLTVKSFGSRSYRSQHMLSLRPDHKPRLWGSGVVSATDAHTPLGPPEQIAKQVDYWLATMLLSVGFLYGVIVGVVL